MTAQDLDSQYITFTDAQAVYGSEQALPLFVVKHPLCEAVLSLYGGQLLEFKACDEQPLLWLSPLTPYREGASIRGGIPVCFPWFGVADDQALPRHGFVRNRLWSIREMSEDEQGVNLSLHYVSSNDDLALYPYQFEIVLDFSLSQHLSIDLTVQNLSDKTMPVTWALHTYLAVNELKDARVEGLDGREYLDNTRDLSRHIQNGPLSFDREVDRVYTGLSSAPVLKDIDNGRALAATAQNAPSAIIWNPGAALADSMPDVVAGFNGFVCIERGAAFDDRLALASGDSLKATIGFETV